MNSIPKRQEYKFNGNNNSSNNGNNNNENNNYMNNFPQQRQYNNQQNNYQQNSYFTPNNQTRYTCNITLCFVCNSSPAQINNKYCSFYCQNKSNQYIHRYMCIGCGKNPSFNGNKNEYCSYQCKKTYCCKSCGSNKYSNMDFCNQSCAQTYYFINGHF